MSLHCHPACCLHLLPVSPQAKDALLYVQGYEGHLRREAQKEQGVAMASPLRLPAYKPPPGLFRSSPGAAGKMQQEQKSEKAAEHLRPPPPSPKSTVADNISAAQQQQRSAGTMPPPPRRPPAAHSALANAGLCLTPQEAAAEAASSSSSRSSLVPPDCTATVTRKVPQPLTPWWGGSSGREEAIQQFEEEIPRDGAGGVSSTIVAAHARLQLHKKGYRKEPIKLPASNPLQGLGGPCRPIPAGVQPFILGPGIMAAAREQGANYRDIYAQAQGEGFRLEGADLLLASCRLQGPGGEEHWVLLALHLPTNCAWQLDSCLAWTRSHIQPEDQPLRDFIYTVQKFRKYAGGSNTSSSRSLPATPSTGGSSSISSSSSSTRQRWETCVPQVPQQPQSSAGAAIYTMLNAEALLFGGATATAGEQVPGSGLLETGEYLCGREYIRARLHPKEYSKACAQSSTASCPWWQQHKGLAAAGGKLAPSSKGKPPAVAAPLPSRPRPDPAIHAGEWQRLREEELKEKQKATIVNWLTFT